jgi:hypothetical protein
LFRSLNVISSTSSSILYIQKTRSTSAQLITLSLEEFIALLWSIDHDASSAHRLTAMQQPNPLSFLSFVSQVVLADVLRGDLVSRAIVLIGGTFAVRFSPTRALLRCGSRPPMRAAAAAAALLRRLMFPDGQIRSV